MLRKLFIWGNVVLLVLFVAAVVEDLAGPYFPHHWANIQMHYRSMQVAAEPAAEARASIQSRPIEIKQIMANDIGQIDRCTSCHQGMDSLATPSLQNSFAENPFKSHPGNFLKDHPPENSGASSVTGARSLPRPSWERLTRPRTKPRERNGRKNTVGSPPSIGNVRCWLRLSSRRPAPSAMETLRVCRGPTWSPKANIS